MALRFEGAACGFVYQLGRAIAGHAEVGAGSLEAFEGVGWVGLEDRGQACRGLRGDHAQLVTGEQLGEGVGVLEGVVQVLRVVL